MAIARSRQQSDLEKRLQLLRRQVYGKPEEPNSEPSGAKKTGSAYSFNNLGSTSGPKNHAADTAFLQGDLLKIMTLSSLAIGAEVILYFLIKNNVLKLNFF